MIRLRAAALLAIVSTCVGAQARGKWMRIDDSDEGPKRVPLTTCPSLVLQTSKPPIPGAEKGATEVTPIGTISLFATKQDMKVSHVIHRFSGQYGKAWVMRIFVERATDQFCEIYRMEGNDDAFWGPGRPFIVEADRTFLMAGEGNQILGMRSDVRGTAHLRLEAYWVFDAGGPVELKPHEVVHDAIRELLPTDGYIREAGSLNMSRMCYVTPVWRPENEVSGSLLVKFALKGTSLIVTHKEYTTSKDGFDRHEQECPIN